MTLQISNELQLPSEAFRNALSRLRPLELISGRGEIRANDYLTDCLAAFDKASQNREVWYGKALSINPDDAPWVLDATGETHP